MHSRSQIMVIGVFTQNILKGGLDTFLTNLFLDFPGCSRIYLFINYLHPGLPSLQENLPDNVVIVPYYFLLAYDIDSRLYLPHKYIRFIFKFLFWLFGYFYHIFLIYFLLRPFHLDQLLIVNGGYPGGDACQAASLSWYLSNRSNKAIMNFHNLALPYPSNPIKLIKEIFIDLIISLTVSKVVSVSKSCLSSLSKRKFVSRLPSSFIYNGLNPSLDDHNESEFSLHKYLDIPKSANIVLMLATYEKRKGHSFLFEAMKYVFSSCPNTYLAIFGDSLASDFSNVQDLSRSSNFTHKIILNGFITNPREVIAQSNVLVIPSQSYESFGYTAIEAMAVGVPVVATSVGGLTEVIQNGCDGYVVDPSDSIGFASGISTILSDTTIALRFSDNGKIKVRNKFSSKKMATDYYNLLKNPN